MPARETISENISATVKEGIMAKDKKKKKKKRKKGTKRSPGGTAGMSLAQDAMGGPSGGAGY